MTTTSKGRAGEDLAVLHLERVGYTIVGRNVRAGRGEIDVVAREGELLCFVEVRRRAHADDALGSIDAKKRAHLVRAATAYLATLEEQPQCRFDVVIVSGDTVDLLRGAFEAEAEKGV